MQKKLIAAMVMLAVNHGANAADNDWLKFSGFGTLGVVHSSDKGADFRNNIEQTSGAGLSNKLDSGVDSVFGAQADVQIAPGLTGTAQVVTRRMSDYNSTKPAFEWANLKYQVTRDLFVRGGRIVAHGGGFRPGQFIGAAWIARAGERGPLGSGRRGTPLLPSSYH